MSRNPSASNTTMTTVQAQLAAAAQMIASGAARSSRRSVKTLNLGDSVSNFDAPPGGMVAALLEAHNKQAHMFLQQLLTTDKDKPSMSSGKMSFKEAFDEYADLKHRLDDVGEDTEIGCHLKCRCLFLEKVMDDTEFSGHSFSTTNQESIIPQQQADTGQHNNAQSPQNSTNGEH